MSVWHKKAMLEQARSAPSPADTASAQAAPPSPAAPQAYADHIDPRLHDFAHEILHAAPVDDETKASAWDHYHDAKSSAHLAGLLQGLPLPAEIAGRLIEAKKFGEPELTTLDKAVAAIRSMGQMDEKVLQIAESHPTILKHFTDAVKKED